MAAVDSTHPAGAPGVLFDVPAPLELHLTSWAQGGPTSAWHNAHTHGGWQPTICPCGTVTWHSPHGQTYRAEPHDYRLGP